METERLPGGDVAIKSAEMTVAKNSGDSACRRMEAGSKKTLDPVAAPER